MPISRKKIVIVGPTAVGKTSIIARYIVPSFDISGHEVTITPDFSQKTHTFGADQVKFSIVDTPGDPKHFSLASSVFHNCDFIIFVSSFDNALSVESMAPDHPKSWTKHILDSITDIDSIRCYYFINKEDLLTSYPPDLCVDKPQIARIFDEIKHRYPCFVQYHYVSALENPKEIGKIFEGIAKSVTQTHPESTPTEDTPILPNPDQTSVSPCCKCCDIV
ncbi:Small GTPase like protein [Aduncisulcus paluster]|uniref:Small GTPase like protein n=1 Tax=Aduncisulcus paluster TaxID=2918883 RepID=A0ABQ5JYC0_9EUKA|nr:Small GTPase like protein [Aduncisulcus paluster]